MERYIDIANAACEAAMRSGADCADVHLQESVSRAIGLELGEVKNVDARSYSGVSVRAFSRGGCGWASASKLDEADARAAGEAAATLAKAADADPDFHDLPVGGPLVEIEGLWDEAVAALTLSDLLGYLTPEIEAVRAVAPDAIIGGGSGLWSGGSVYVNSKGTCVTQRGSGVGCYISTAVRRGDDVGAYGDGDHGRRMSDFDPAGIGKRTAEESLRLLGSRTAPSGVFPVLFSKECGRNVLMPLIHGANAEDVQRKRTWLVGKQGEQVASQALTMVDDPFIPGGGGSSPADGEGVPHKKLTVVDRGVLTTYLHNSYTAGKAAVENTAHSTRGGISPTNCNPATGDRTEAELLSAMGTGLYVNSGGLAVNDTSGDFSQVVDTGYWVENGEIAYPVKETMISGTYVDFLRAIQALSSDPKVQPGSISPAVLVGKIRVVAR